MASPSSSAAAAAAAAPPFSLNTPSQIFNTAVLVDEVCRGEIYCVEYHYEGPCVKRDEGGVIKLVPHGKNGKFTYAKEITYEGDVSEGLPHGTGMFIDLPKGCLYKGGFQRGFPEGHGKAVYIRNGKVTGVYEGMLKDSLPSGQAKYFDVASGTTYDGAWLNGKKHGQGIESGTINGRAYKKVVTYVDGIKQPEPKQYVPQRPEVGRKKSFFIWLTS